MTRPASAAPNHTAARRPAGPAAAATAAFTAVLLLAGCASATGTSSGGGRPGAPGPAASQTGTVRPAGEVIPPAALLDVTPVYPLSQNGSNATGSVLAVTDSAQIAKITGLVNALPAMSQGFYCPDDDGAGVLLVFRASSGKELASINADATGCGGVTVTIGGVAEPALSGGPALITQIAAILGQHWQLARDPASSPAS